jgi:two-component system sensor histidine kinase/response regulator
VSGLALRQLRIEFDARLEAMRSSIEEAESARKRAEEADKTKSQFLANMSHELRTPLNAIIGYDEAMLAGMAGEFTPQQTQLLGHIQHNSRRLLTLINDILDLSKIESGSTEFYFAPMSPIEVITDALNGVRSLADQKLITLDVEISDDLPTVVIGDAHRVEQVLVNLLSNAIKFTEQGGVLVSANLLNDRQWQFSISDTGIGIATDALTSIFEPFVQVDGSPTRKYKGTGLGLAITKKLVDGMRGSVAVESVVGSGTKFVVILPVDNASLADSPEDAAE